MSRDEALWLVAHWVTVQFALCLGSDRRAVGQGKAIQRCLGVALQKGCTEKSHPYQLFEFTMSPN